MLKLGKRLAAVRIHDRLKSILVLIRFLGQQVVLGEKRMWRGEVVDVDGNVVPVVFRDRAFCLLVDELLTEAHRDLGALAFIIVRDRRRRVQDALVEPRDSFGGARGNEHLGVWDAEIAAREAVGTEDADVIAPGTGHLDETVRFPPGELGIGQRLPDTFEASLQVVQTRHHHADVAAPLLGRVLQQMELLLAGVHPHDGPAEIDIGIARQADARHVEDSRKVQVRDAQVDVLQDEHVADVLFASVELYCFTHDLSSSRSRICDSRPVILLNRLVADSVGGRDASCGGSAKRVFCPTGR